MFFFPGERSVSPLNNDPKYWKNMYPKKNRKIHSNSLDLEETFILCGKHQGYPVDPSNPPIDHPRIISTAAYFYASEETLRLLWHAMTADWRLGRPTWWAMYFKPWPTACKFKIWLVFNIFCPQIWVMWCWWCWWILTMPGKTAMAFDIDPDTAA